jgi:uncharacterized protein (TIGR02466 family)
LHAGQYAEAAAALDRVLTIEPGHAQALDLLRELAQMTGRDDIVLPQLRAAWEREPGDPRQRIPSDHRRFRERRPPLSASRSMMSPYPVSRDLAVDIASLLTAAADHEDAERHGDAAAAYGRILAEEPGHAEALDRFRALAARFGRLDLFAPYLRKAWELHPQRGELLVEWGESIFQAIGLAETISVFEEAVRRCPDSAILHAGLARFQERYLRAEEAQASYRRAIELDPANASAHLGLAKLLYDADAWDEALAASERAVALAPNEAFGHNCIGQVRAKQGRFAEAAAAFRLAAAANPKWDVPAAGLVNALLRLGDHDEAARAAVEASARVGYATSLFAARYFAHLAQGDAAAARELLDFDRSIVSVTFPVPLGFNDHASFHRSLAHELRSEPSLIWEPSGRTTRGGHQTSTLMLQPGLAMRAFLHNLRPHVDAYAETLPADHPFRTRTVESYGLDVWATILESGGHQMPHIHRSGHVSGVYYVELPQSLGQTPDDNAGWIEFGRAPEEMKLPLEPPTRRLQPYEGMLVLFPSYVYHRTIPFVGGGQRISIAFDVSV